MDNNSLKIAQYNVEGVINKKPLLIEFLQDNKIDICLLNETWLKENNNFYIPNYTIINQLGVGGRGGVSILVRDCFKYSNVSIPFNDELQSVAIILHTDIGKLSLLCVYCPPPKHGRSNFESRKLKRIINNLPKPVMVSGDFNAHHVAFGCLSINKRGSDIYDVFDECDLCILNTGSPTTIGRAGHNPSAIDVSCISPSMAPLCDWNVHSDCMGSYHFPTIVNINISVEKYDIGMPTERFLYNKADWVSFTSASENAFDTISNEHTNALNYYNEFCVILNDIKNKYIPTFKNYTNYIRKKPVPWWDDECKEAVTKSKQALNFYRSHPTIQNYIEYKKVDAYKKRLISIKKKNSWLKLSESFNRYTPVTIIWNYIRRFKRASSSKQSKNDEWILDFFEKYAPISASERNKNFNMLDSYFNNKGNPSAQFLIEPFTWLEFKTSLQSRKDTTPGLDDIKYILIKNLHVNAQKLLLHIFNLLWESQTIPSAWKTQCVIPILKPNKPIDDCNSYRPISLSSCIGKIFENMLKLRLDYYTESNNILPSEQFGFRKGRSATESFTSLIADIKKSFFHSVTVCAFLDIKGAFDNVDPSILVHVLFEIGIPGKFCKWIFNFLHERTMHVKFNNILHGPRKVYKGTMQGATISPILYNIYTCQIKQYLKENNVQFLQFADDLLVYTVNKDVNIAVNKLNSALSQIHNYYHHKLRLDVSSSKSSAMIFSKRCTLSFLNNDVMYNNQPLPWVESHKFLGVYLDPKLSFQKHINNIVGNASKGLNVLRSLAGVHWGADPQILSMLYKSLIRSHFDYSSLAYMSANSSVLRKLDIIQNKALRIITGAMCSTPIHVMQSETCIPPLAIRRLQLAERFCLKLVSSNNSLVQNSLLSLPLIQTSQETSYYVHIDLLKMGHTPELETILIYILKTYENLYINSTWPLYKFPYNALVNCNIDLCTEKIHNNTDLMKFIDNKNYYRIYTDGSKSENRVTSAYYDAQISISKNFLINNNCSIYTAECYAIYQALLYLKSLNSKHNKFLILSDSLSVLNSLENTCKYDVNYLILFIKHLLFILNGCDKIIHFLWVPSHCGITGNEKADAATRGPLDFDHSSLMKIPFTDCRSQITQKLLLLWKDYWEFISEEKGKWYKKIQGSPPAQPWWYNKQIDNRKYITTINRMRFGHGQFRTHLKRLNMVESRECAACGVDEDLEHIVLECQRYGLQRLILVHELQLMHKTQEISRSLEELLKDTINYKAIYKFITNTVTNI
jgi:ribonuclease HI